MTAPGAPPLWEALLRGDSHGTLRHDRDDGYAPVPWRRVVADAHRAAAALRAAGVGPGTRVAAVLTNEVEVVSGLLAIWIAGGAVASLPLPAHGQTPGAYGAQLAALTENLDPVALVVADRMRAYVPDGLAARLPVLDWARLDGGGRRVEPCPPGGGDIAFIQYSSGSTSVPKGCALTTDAISAQLGLIGHLLPETRPDDVVYNWLPLSHDMGVFGTLLFPWVNDLDLLLSSPERFGRAPRAWFRDMAAYGVTLTAGTNTALYLAARAQGRTPLPAPPRLRAVVIGAERVDPDTITTVIEKLGAHGVPPSALIPAYGMAEATLAVSASPSADPPVTRAFDGPALLDGRVAATEPDAPGATRLVSNGPPLPGVTVTTAAGGVSELLVGSPSLASGYYGEPERTAERFRDGVLRTGDLGFLHDGEVYLAGRTDDLISVGGRNVYTSEIESAVEALGPVRAGCSALVDVPVADGPRLVLLAEPRRRGEDFARLADRAAAVALETSGVALAECVFVERGRLPRTPSGKIQRFRCRAMLRDDDDGLRAIARVRLG